MGNVKKSVEPVKQEVLEQFVGKLQGIGLVVDQSSVVTDGKLHRCGTLDKENGQDGSYVIHLGDLPNCWGLNWRTSEECRLSSKADAELSREERKALQQACADSKKKAEEQRKAQQEQAASLAREVWESCSDADTQFPYLQRKQVLAFDVKHGCGIARKLGLSNDFNGNVLLVPLYDENGRIVSLSSINEKGEKCFLAGGRTKGCFFAITASDSQQDPLLIAEGYATGASLHMATGYAIWVAFSAGNLLDVAKLARKRYPKREIVVCADWDQPNKTYSELGGTGFAKARGAAFAVGARLAVPNLQDVDKVDFNDVHCKLGLKEVKEQVQQALRENEEKISAMSNCDKPQFDIAEIPDGFELNDSGLWAVIPPKKEGDEPEDMWLGKPLYVEGLARDSASRSWGRVLSWYDPDGVLHRQCIQNELLYGRDSSLLVAKLAEGGYQAECSSKAKAHLVQYIASYTPKRRLRLVQTTGWHDGSFVFPNSVFGVGTVGTLEQACDGAAFRVPSHQTCSKKKLEHVFLQCGMQENPYQVQGSLEKWCNTLGVWAQGNSRLMLAICAALAGPLLHLVGVESGGVHLIGASSCGKSTALAVAASVWGKGSGAGGFVKSWRATSNGLEAQAALHNDTLLVLDELGQASGRVIQEAAYLLGNGTGKSRAVQTGDVRKGKTWRCTFLSSGEISLEDKIKADGGRVQAGQLTRLADIPADAGVGLGLFENLHGFKTAQEFADKLKRFAATYYGSLARVFVAELEKHYEEVVECTGKIFDEGLQEFCNRCSDGQVQRVARRFLLFAVAGEIATQFGLLPWHKRDALEACKRCFQAWLDQRGGTGSAEDKLALEQILLFLEQHGTSRFQEIADRDSICRDRVGFRELKDEITYYYVLPKSFQNELCKGINATRAAKLLAKKKILLPGENGYQTNKRLPGLGVQRCYVLQVKSDEAEGEKSEGLARPIA